MSCDNGPYETVHKSYWKIPSKKFSTLSENLEELKYSFIKEYNYTGMF